MCIATGQGQTTPGDKIFLFIILYMYIAPGQGLTTPWGRNLMSTGTSCHFGHLLQVSKKSLWNLILYNFSMILYMYIAPGQGQSAPGDKIMMSTKMSYHFIHLLQVSKEMSSKSEFIHFFHDLIHVYSPGAGADSPQGTKVWCQQKCPTTLPICCKFQRNLFEVWFCTLFFMI